MKHIDDALATEKLIKFTASTATTNINSGAQLSEIFFRYMSLILICLQKLFVRVLRWVLLLNL